ncbi:VanZ family protein [Flavobacterium psychrotolerans]|uniref:VanZ-like domain-containing protein n=1 Tax=Flavobacterium psychrotolerans TaxID=2169410 RepID=A0A2U1JKJ8_9FLAO|nr:VanZ family protein [Flavobacterium psychrotolerans]PWA05677.1 hypothetical protein DB895_06765 [Flavobacterium psychrotolerans]
MIRVFKKVLIHPVFIFFLIALLECIPYHPISEKIAQYEMPKVGDNFGILNDQSIYYYSGKGKYSYPSVECYFSLGNPTFDTPYKDGGIKTIAKSIADQIPLLGSMCGKEKLKVVKNKNNIPLKRYFSTNYLLDNFSNLSHVLSYLILAFSILFYVKYRNNNYFLAFFFCFLGGGLLEFVQYFFIVGRTASYQDQVLNCVGAILGIMSFWFFKKLVFWKYI